MRARTVAVAAARTGTARRAAPAVTARNVVEEASADKETKATANRKATTKHAAAKKAASSRPAARPAAKSPVVRPKGGEPSQRLADRRQKFVEVAEQLFLERGFAGTSVNEVVRVAGGSLATLYAEFKTKEALFEAVLGKRAKRIFENGLPEPSHIEDVAAELRVVANCMQTRILSTENLAMYRLAVSEGPRFPGLRKAVLKTGLLGFLIRLSDYFAQLAQAQRLRIDDPMLAAENFLTLVQGQQLFTAACGDGARISTAKRERHLADVIHAFLCIYPPCSGALHKA